MFKCWWNHPLSAKHYCPGQHHRIKTRGSQVDVVLQNLSGREVILELHTEVGMISAANKIQLMLAPEVIEENVQDDEDDEKVHCKSAQVDLSEFKSRHAEVDLEEILQKVDLLGTTDWDSAEQQGSHNLIGEYACIFSWNDIDFSKTSIVKHSIKLTDFILFKECYKFIPSGMHEKVKAHIQEMFDIGSIYPCNSPWACAVVLVHKKYGKLQFCIECMDS